MLDGAQLLFALVVTIVEVLWTYILELPESLLPLPLVDNVAIFKLIPILASIPGVV